MTKKKIFKLITLIVELLTVGIALAVTDFFEKEE